MGAAGLLEGIAQAMADGTLIAYADEPAFERLLLVSCEAKHDLAGRATNYQQCARCRLMTIDGD